MELPLFFSVTPRELLAPTPTLPKPTLLGVAVSCEIGDAPEPDREIVVGELLASLETVRLPVTLPEEEGAKRTCKVKLWPTAIEERGVPLAMENEEPERFVWETVTEAVPLFFNVTLRVELAPTVTFPKLRLVGLADRVFEPAVDWVFEVV